MRFTHRTPVSGRLQCSIVTIRRFAPATRSIAPPIPFTIAPGTIQLAMSPCSDTSIDPRIDRSTLPPRIIANESALEKNAAPLMIVTVCLPALMRSIDVAVGRKWSEAQDAVLGLEDDFHAG